MTEISNFELFFASIDVFLPLLFIAILLFICTIGSVKFGLSDSFSFVFMGFCNGAFCAYLWARGLQATPIQLSIVFVLISTPLIGLYSGKLSFKSGSIAAGSMSVSFVCFTEYFLRALPLNNGP